MGGFTLIPFPNVPDVPGVPQLNRAANAVIAQNPALSIGIGAVENVLISALQQSPRWGIFDQDGQQLGLLPNSQSTLQAIGSAALGLISGSRPASLSTFAFEFMKETRISDFPVEAGEFASYNKVQAPANPVVTLILDGTENDRTAFLDAINAACIGTDLYNVVTPEYQYGSVRSSGSGVGYSVERYSYSRRSSRGATLLIVEVSLKEVRQVSPAYTQGQIVAPVNPASTPAVNNGSTQQAAPPTSVLKSLTVGVSSSFSAMFGGG